MGGGDDEGGVGGGLLLQGDRWHRKGTLNVHFMVNSRIEIGYKKAEVLTLLTLAHGVRKWILDKGGFCDSNKYVQLL